MHVIWLDLTGTIMNLYLFFALTWSQNMMADNSLSIHIESRNIFYDNFNTNVNFYNFLLVQQDKTKQFILKRTSYHHSFERYMKKFLPAFSLKEREKWNLLTNKNSTKYLLYKINNWIQSLNAEKVKVKIFIKAKIWYWPD